VLQVLRGSAAEAALMKDFYGSAEAEP